MAKSRIYPKANRTAQWWESKFSRGTFTRIEKILLHTTETTGWPGYSAGASAPTLTYNPRTREWRQHNYLNRSARALMDPAGTPVRENRDNVIQIEIICYSDEKIAERVGGLKVSELTDVHLKDIGDFIGYVRQQWGGPPLVHPRFVEYPRSAWADSPVRMTSAQYDAYQGIVGHMHASGNTHGDPSDINIDRIIHYAAAYGSVPSGAEPSAPPLTVEKETDVELTDKVTLTEGVRKAIGTNLPELSVGGLMQYAAAGYFEARRINSQMVGVNAQVAGLSELVKQLAAKDGIDVTAVIEATKQAAHEGAAAGAETAIDELIDGATVNLST